MTTPRLVVIGDSMLDIDIDGTATRLSPEAPVPVVDGDRMARRPGGAGLAAVLAARRGSDVVLITALASDEHGDALRALLEEAGVRVVAAPLPGATACKMRIRADGHPVLRLDQGDGRAGPVPLDAGTRRLVRSADAICVADYGRGITADAGVRTLLAEIALEVPLVWDPHPRGAPPVPFATLVTPNEAEARHFSRLQRGADVIPVHELQDRWQARAVSVTLGRRGALLVTGTAARTHVQPAAAVTMHGDTCGAGDRFAIAATEALATGASTDAAVHAAVDAAANFVAAGAASAVSTVTPLSPVSVAANVGTHLATVTPDVEEVAARLRQGDRTLVATGGCFDLLHTGHVRLLHRARQLGDALVVLLNSDASVRALKGESRPLSPAPDRARVLAALACVDAVCIFDDSSPEQVLARLRPDIWVKGGDYTLADLPEADVVRRGGGEVVLLPTVPGYSTSNLIAAARSDI
ncbi:bifunctional protein HldE [Mycolicibacterium murale]|jgi:D-beta-D-heptose 7-phosphate kinase/D-beta-D-heptose 1-phosphate adenosyltransferase|uniref:Bifunctional protein HldE n=1 Tax=Mycolicibacterium murale TaxID=182220 RepID=A0A7I9WRN2_9MYCO|nr:PfkB family carbohydrate kinase [Mycolicibacterium murale]MCV7185991.1 bifunctional heptose 7-phosphate kinase/heptose 1-phosphate adenyltransferase [Mycolicibacterium murale]GFG60219.1 bifunctional protein HldE [Mycolicibacterium murale]